MAYEKAKRTRPANQKHYPQTAKIQVLLSSLTQRLSGANLFKIVTLGLCAGLTGMVIVNAFAFNEDRKLRGLEVEVRQLLEERCEESGDQESWK